MTAKRRSSPSAACCSPCRARAWASRYRARGSPGRCASILLTGASTASGSLASAAVRACSNQLWVCSWVLATALAQAHSSMAVISSRNCDRALDMVPPW